MTVLHSELSKYMKKNEDCRFLLKFDDFLKEGGCIIRDEGGG